MKEIRERLGVTQAAMAGELDCTQSNISFYERGQTVPPATAGKLIAFAARRGYVITYDHVYGEPANLPSFVCSELEDVEAKRRG